MDWSAVGLREHGFGGFVRFADLPDADVPDEPGVYVVLRDTDEAPSFLARSVAGWFKGRDPSVPVERLVAKWIADVSVLYIGKATPGRANRIGLRRRLDEYRRIGTGRPVGHWGGRFIWQLADHETLTVAWKVVDDRSATEVEDQLIKDFVSRYRALPFANLRHEKQPAVVRIRPSELLARHRDDVIRIARSHHATDVRVFGSVARGEDTPGSDVDLLVAFDDDVTLLDITTMTMELKELLGCGVDVIEDAGLRPGDDQIRAEARSL